MSLIINQPAPEFITTDVFGHAVDLKELKGKKIYLAFERNAGCPVCNLRVHTLLKNAEHFSKNNVAVLLIYESTVEKMKEYLENESYPFHFVADPKNRLYKLYFVEQSFNKFFKSLFNGLMKKATEGKKLFKKEISQDGNVTTIPSEFIIDENGKMITAHYGKFIGDHLPVEILFEKIKA